MTEFKKLYGVDRKKENDGVWVEIAAAKDGKPAFEVLVARAGNSKYMARIRGLAAKNKRALRNDPENKLNDKLTIEAVADAILLDWRGLEYEGQSLPYSKENAIKLLTESKDFRDEIGEIASDMQTYKMEEQEETLKNSKKASAGT